MAMTLKFVYAVIDYGWEPYQKGGWLDLGRMRGGATITFKGHEQHEYRCSNETARKILKYAKNKIHES